VRERFLLRGTRIPLRSPLTVRAERRVDANAELGSAIHSATPQTEKIALPATLGRNLVASHQAAMDRLFRPRSITALHADSPNHVIVEPRYAERQFA
jgi:hypothetical protein